eukprot:1154148-Pelagomonas_calceolata.AAC.2
MPRIFTVFDFYQVDMAVLDVHNLPGWSCAAPYLFVTSHTAEEGQGVTKITSGLLKLRLAWSGILGSKGWLCGVDLVKYKAKQTPNQISLDIASHSPFASCCTFPILTEIYK